MKIKNIYIKKEKALKDIDICFEKNNKILNTIIIAGSNGTGKTTILESIYNYLEEYDIFSKNIPISFKFEGKERTLLRNWKNDKKDRKNLEKEKSIPKIIYMPTELNFKKLNTKTTTLKLDYKFLNKVDSKLIEDIPSYIASKVIETANNNEDLTMKQAKELVFKEINDIFEILKLNVKLTGISKDAESMPIFTNHLGVEFDINDLSSGEKQLFLRTLAIKMMEPKNSIIMIDEPESSLHPKWQQRIVKVIERIGENNQIILATHSPHILGSVPKENIILLIKGEKGIIVAKTGDELYDSYGQPVGRILEDIMGLETDRNPEVYLKLEEVRKMVRDNKYDTKEFENKMKKLENELGADNEDLFLIKMDIQIRKKGGI